MSEVRSPSSTTEGVEQVLNKFLLLHATQALLRMLREPTLEAPPVILLNFLQLVNFNAEAAEALLATPQAIINSLAAATVGAQHEILKKQHNKENLSLKPSKVRLTGLASLLKGGYFPSIGQLRSGHVGMLIAVNGTVMRTSAAQVLEATRHYECDRCGYQFAVEVDIQAGATAQLPARCPSTRAKPCKGTSFRHLSEVQQHTDFQELRIQEKGNNLAMGAVPAAVDVIVQDDLVDLCQPGDDVNVTGIVSQQWKSSYVGARCEVDIALMANNVELDESKKAAVEVTVEAAAIFEEFWRSHRKARLAARNEILGCLCPQIHGMLTVKLATFLMLIGGLRRGGGSGTRVRGEIHMLLIGDPGTGKSQFLKYAAQLSPRSIVTSGKGSSAAGLTATAVKDGQHWGLEAGAMVLADGGLCCIDEFDGLKEPARAAIHEAMEQQTVSVAKAGMLTTLNSRTTVFGVANPKGTYDPRESLSANTSLSGPLLSRFDILLVLQDLKSSDWDEGVADHILQDQEAPLQPDALAWDLQRLQQYICWAKRFEPVMTLEAESVLGQYYQIQRQSSVSEAARTTVRMLESLVRLAQAHARLLAQQEVRQADAVVAVLLMDASMGDAALLSANPMLCASADDAEADFERLQQRLLQLIKNRLQTCA